MPNESWRGDYLGGNFIDFKTGPFTGEFVDVKEGENKWGKCSVLVFNDEKGNKKTYSTSSKRLLGKLANIPYGTIVKISRFGQSVDTMYEVDVLKSKQSERVKDTVKEASQKMNSPEVQGVIDKFGGNVTQGWED